MIREAHGDLLAADADALVNTVNTVGVMGKGIALQFKRAYPSMFREYQLAAKHGEIRMGKVHVFRLPDGATPAYIISFPTKRHWKGRSKLHDIETGLADLVSVVASLGINSIALPPLGCGNGGLSWTEVRPLIAASFAALPRVEVIVYAPEGSPAAAAMTTRTRRPNMTVGRAALIQLVRRYAERAFEVSLLEIQKLLYFQQAAGERLKLNYSKGRYGPYSSNLQHVLNEVEGHFLIGYGDASKAVHASEPIELLPGAVDLADSVLEGHPATRARVDRVLRLAQGFESAYGMELLATVHWIATVDTRVSADDPVAIARTVHDWSHRKKSMFGVDHVTIAWNHLRDEGWLTSSASSSQP